MSWDAYVDNLIAQSKGADGNCHIDKACIIGLDGSQWTSEAPATALKIVADERRQVASCMKSKDFNLFMQKGVFLEGKKYQFLRTEGNAVYAKKKDLGAVSIQCSKQAVLIAHCPEGKQQGIMNKAIGVVADHLEATGY